MKLSRTLPFHRTGDTLCYLDMPESLHHMKQLHRWLQHYYQKGGVATNPIKLILPKVLPELPVPWRKWVNVSKSPFCWDILHLLGLLLLVTLLCNGDFCTLQTWLTLPANLFRIKLYVHMELFICIITCGNTLHFYSVNTPVCLHCRCSSSGTDNSTQTQARVYSLVYCVPAFSVP